MTKSIWPLAVSIVATSLMAQVEAPPVATLRLEPANSIIVESAIAPGVVTPFVCASDRVFLRMASQAGVSDIFSVTLDGKNLTRYATERIYEVTNPSERRFFVSGSTVYVLVMSTSNPRPRTLRVPMPDGSVQEQHTSSPTVRKFAIARFGLDGAYHHTVELDIPFLARQFAVFKSGDFLVTGISDDARGEPQVALVASSGRLMRILELQQDIQADSPDFKRQDTPPAITGTGDMRAAIDLSAIIADGEDLVLYRPGTHAAVFVISGGGAVRPLKLNAPSKAGELFSLRQADEGWYAQYIKRLGEGQGVSFSTYLFNRLTGEPITSYEYPKGFGFGLACVGQSKFTFLKETNGKLTIVNMTPARTATVPAPKE